MTFDSRISRRAFATSGGSAALVGLSGLGARPAFAQQGRPIQLILPVAAGSGVDALTRAAQTELQKAFGAPIVINNQPGAGGVVGTQLLTRAAPDGLTLSVISINHVIYPSVLKNLPFDPIADITPVMTLVTTPMVLVVSPKKVPAKSLKELTALLKANPEKYHYASSGAGTVLHLAGAMYLVQADLKATHVPYKGVGPMLNDLIGGHADMGVFAYPSIISHLKSGALTAIGVCSTARLAAAPDIPTMVEQGMPNYLIEGWSAVAGPPKLPASDVARIHAAFTAAYKSEFVATTIARQASSLEIRSPEQTAKFLKDELVKYATISKAIGLEPQ